MLQRGDLIPHFDVTTVYGCRVRYSAIWQRRNLVLITLAPAATDAANDDIARFANRMPEFAARDTECIITRAAIAGTGAPGVLVADRWGEIVHVAVSGSGMGGLPPVDELLEWAAYLQGQCPECQGEAK